jgi:ADP-heptose:LPS heptosyltransferase
MIERRSAPASAREPVPFVRLLEEPKKILVIPSRGAKGFPFAIPSLSLLRERFPNTSLHVLADADSAEIFRRDSHADVVHVLDAAGSLLQIRNLVAAGKMLAKEEFDITLWLDDEIDAERRLAVLLASGKARIGRGDADGLFNCEFRYAGEERYAALEQLALTRRVVRNGAHASPLWRVDDKLRERARQLAHFWKPRREDYLFVVDPGSGLAGARPSAETLRGIVELLKKTYPCKVLIASEPAYAEAVRLLARETARWEPLLIPQTSLAETGALLGHADLVVSGNTALFHFAWVLGVPSLGLFGRLDPERHVPPSGGRSVVIRSTEGLEPAGFLERVNILLTKFPRALPSTS